MSRISSSSVIIRTLWRRMAWPNRTSLFALILYVALGIFTLFAITQLIQSIDSSLRQQAQQLMGCDLKLTSWRPLEGAWYQQAQSILPKTSKSVHSIQTSTMVTTLDIPHPFLVSLKAIQSLYPLRGEIELSQADQTQLHSKEVWIHQQLAQQRQLKIGQHLLIGQQKFTIRNIILKEPDAGIAGALSFAPRIMIRHEDFKQLPLLQFGSRIQRQWQIIIPQDQKQAQSIKKLVQDLQNLLPDDVNLQSYLQAQPNTAQIFERIALFFSMIALLTLCLCLLALIHGFWDLLFQQLPHISYLQHMGVTRKQIQTFYLQQSLLIGMIGSILAVIMGSLLSIVVQSYTEKWLPFTLHFYFDVWGILATILVGVITCWLINLCLQRSLARIPLYELHRNANPNLQFTRAEQLGLGTLLLIAITLYLWNQTGSYFIALLFVACLSILYFLYTLFVSFAFYLCHLYLKIQSNKAQQITQGFALRMLLAKRKQNYVLILNISLGFTFMMSLQQIHQQLISALSIDQTSKAPIFMFDVQSDQTTPLAQLLKTYTTESVELLPITRARLSSLKGEKIQAQNQQAQLKLTMKDKLKARTLYREYNLTSRAKLGHYEEILKGRWWNDDEASQENSHWISLEERLAQRLDLTVGDEMSLDIQGIEIKVQVMSIRRVNWLSLRPNFLMVLPPAVLQHAPKTWIAGLPIPADQVATLVQDTFQKFPNISVVDLRPIFQEAKRLLNALKHALNMSTLLCIMAGLLLFLLAIRRDVLHKKKQVKLLYDLGIHQGQAKQWVRKEYFYLSYIMLPMVAIGVFLISYAANRALRIPLSIDFISYGIALSALYILPALLSRTQKIDV